MWLSRKQHPPTHKTQHLQDTSSTKGKLRALPPWAQIPCPVSSPRWLEMVKVKGTPSVQKRTTADGRKAEDKKVTFNLQPDTQFRWKHIQVTVCVSEKNPLRGGSPTCYILKHYITKKTPVFQSRAKRFMLSLRCN